MHNDTVQYWWTLFEETATENGGDVIRKYRKRD